MIAAPVRWPQQPSASTVTWALMSVPGSKLPSGSPSLPRPLSPERTPTTWPSSTISWVARGLGEDVGAALLGLALLVAGQRRHRDDLVAVVLEVRHRGIGTRSLVFGPVSMYTDSLVTSPKAKRSLRQSSRVSSGNSSCSGPGRITAPDRLCPPQVLAFSMTATGTSPRRLHQLRVVRRAAAAAGWRRPGRRCRRRRSPRPTSISSSSASSPRLTNSSDGVDRRRELARACGLPLPLCDAMSVSRPSWP